ncbi:MULTISPECIES: acyl-CoA dehydrogenase family protein [Pseudoalteromonas]|uniref:Acyl-CoA dehydrogenase n=1 Tax=Pseudoalteromonas luteoviolacea (strain 2ta16) TaxID=1353533 RepID=V4HQN7_PSEL2|nr:acyl-CoA dehydrogenase family protein [Pseudoalteromonas luteoviolacea]ESP90239.1 acyl-CoA dehydrogenase [Pseudoalteromonas luteoviolacea 2ta16]KZN29924.1 hypothetical protein N483_06545 [Pseudoalteromonas luteoviolacea NCIMB 1944]MCG7550601.1 acyl-CoA dehydrogenase family protein [Pseudoalteromonas sp. Of7M-16]
MSKDIDSYNEFREYCRDFLQREAVPYQAQWEQQGLVDRSFWKKLGEAGLLGMEIDPEYGGQGRKGISHTVILTEELISAGLTAPIIISHNDVLASYINAHGTEQQKRRWLPALCSGEKVAAIATTEPGGGSDSTEIKTTAVRDGEKYVVNGSKAYITNGVNADIVVTAVQTGSGQRGQGLSLLALERGLNGFTRGAALKKLGWHASDTAALYFEDCHVPADNLIGRENMGSYYFMTAMTRERLSISSVAVATAETILKETLEYSKNRIAFGQPIGSLQHNKFTLANLDTEVKIARIYLNDAIDKFNRKKLNVDDAARAKLWTTNLQVKVAEQCMQLHGASGYMSDSSMGKHWVNSRVQKIYGGTSEVLQEVIGKSIGL